MEKVVFLLLIYGGMQTQTSSQFLKIHWQFVILDLFQMSPLWIMKFVALTGYLYTNTMSPEANRITIANITNGIIILAWQLMNA